MEKKNNKHYDLIKYVSATILLGAVGSGLWDRFLSGFSDNLISGIAKLFGRLSSGYIDYLYSNVGDGMKEVFSYHTYALIMFFLVLLGMGVGIFGFRVIGQFKIRKSDELKKLRGDENEKDKKKEKPVKTDEEKIAEILNDSRYKNNRIHQLIVVFIVLTLLSFISSVIVKHIYSYNATLYIEKSIDILAPYLEVKERLILKSEYRLIDSYDKFAHLNDKLNTIAKRENIALPEFSIVLK